MSKSDFGRILSSLRRESRNELDEVMTQNDLADLANIPLITLQKIEQGRQANIKPELVRDMANALNLTSHTWQAFFLASLGMNDRELHKTRLDPSIMIEDISGMLAQLQSPALMINSFGDLFMVNPIFMHVMNLQLDKLNQGHLLSKFNINRIFYSPEFADIHRMMGDSYSSFARREVLLFKSLTLKYRNHWYFQKIIPELNRFPNFREHWQSGAFHDEDIFTLSNMFSMKHPRLGTLNFVTFPIQVFTDVIDLFLISYQPLDHQTAITCIRVAQEQGNQPIQISSQLLPAMPGEPS